MDGMPKTPRSRVPNFTSDEKALLAALIIKSKPIVESKRTDGRSVEKKKAAWESITQECNCQVYVHKLTTQEIKKQAAELELQKNKILLEKATLELEILKNTTK